MSLSYASTLALLAFCLLYTPCVAAVAAVKREDGLKGSIELVCFQCAIAWVVGLLVKLLFTAFGL